MSWIPPIAFRNDYLNLSRCDTWVMNRAWYDDWSAFHQRSCGLRLGTATQEKTLSSQDYPNAHLECPLVLRGYSTLSSDIRRAFISQRKKKVDHPTLKAKKNPQKKTSSTCLQTFIYKDNEICIIILSVKKGLFKLGDCCEGRS